MASITAELNESAQLITRQEYFPYGGAAILAGSSEIEIETKRYRFNGQELDGMTGLYYYGQRYYAPGFCRWLTPDPIGTNGGINLYQFSESNPITRVDPNGMQPGWVGSLWRGAQNVAREAAVAAVPGSRGVPTSPTPPSARKPSQSITSTKSAVAT